MTRRTPEHDLQCAASQFFDRALPPGCWHSAIDHTGRGARGGALLKARGVRKGIADHLIFAVCYRHLNLVTYWIEWKIGNARPTKEQNAFAAAVRAAGHVYAVCRTVEQAQALLLSHGVKLRARLT